MSVASFELQKAIVAALAADGAVTALVDDRIYDQTPRSPEFPYVSLGAATATDWSTGTEDGAEHVLTVDAWSRQGGKREAHQIAGAVKAALHDAALAVSGQALVNLRFQFADTRRDPDGITYHAAMRFRAVMEPQ
jgi:hypothetical protein